VKRQYRITRANDFRRVRQNSRTYTHPLIRILVCDEPGEQRRVGIIVSKSVGSAVTRNLVKRRIRSVADEFIQKLNIEAELLIIANPLSAKADYQQIRQAIMDALRKAELLME